MQLGAGKTVKTKDLYDTLKYEKREKVDFGPILKAQIPQNRDLALKEGNLALAVENLLALEKQTRQAGDAIATSEVALSIVQVCKDKGDWPALNANITLLVKRRGQLKQVVTKVVQESVGYLDLTPNKETKLELIHTLRAVSEGKIHTELEHARLTLILAKIYESDGNIKLAADTVQTVQVETYGTMEREEKVSYILEQIRMCLASGDLIRSSIISKKVNVKQFEGDKLSELKLRFYSLMNQISFTKEDYFEIAKNYFAMYNTPAVQEDSEKWMPVLRDVVIFLCMSPYNNEQADMAARVAQDKRLDQIPEWKNLLGFFRSPELARWPSVSQHYLPLVATHAAFDAKNKDKRIEVLHTRLIQHNIRVVAKCYTRVSMARLALLLDLPPPLAERHVSDLVSDKQIYARIDRLEGICSFSQRKEPNEVLNEWSRDIGELLGKMEKVCHLIHKEQMIHAKTKNAAAAAAAAAAASTA